MQHEKLFESQGLDVKFDPQQQYVYVNWKGFHSVESVKAGCETLLALLTEKHCKRVLNDNRLVSGPRMYAAGVEQFAWIVSPNVLSLISTKATQARNKNEKTRTFDDVAQAVRWLGIQ